MADIVYILVMVGFFALAAAFVVACERIIGSASPYDAQRGEAPAAPPEPPEPGEKPREKPGEKTGEKTGEKAGQAA